MTRTRYRIFESGEEGLRRLADSLALFECEELCEFTEFDRGNHRLEMIRFTQENKTGAVCGLWAAPLR